MSAPTMPTAIRAGHLVQVREVVDGGLVTFQAVCRTPGCWDGGVWYPDVADAVADAHEHLRDTRSPLDALWCTALVAQVRAARLAPGGHRVQVQAEDDYDADGPWVSYQALCLEEDCDWASDPAGDRAAAVAAAHGHLAATRPQDPPPVRCAGQLALADGEGV